MLICVHAAQYGVFENLQKIDQSVAKYVVDNYSIELNSDGYFQKTWTDDKGEKEVFAFAASFSSVCPHQEKVWLKKNLKGSHRGPDLYYPMSRYCIKNNWYNQEKKFNYTEDARHCDVLSVFIGNQNINMTKTPNINEWSRTIQHTTQANSTYPLQYTVKLIEDRNMDGELTGTYKWGVESNEEYRKGYKYILARTNDSAAQFPYDSKNWLVLCSKTNETCWKGDIVGAGNTEWKPFNDQSPKCYPGVDSTNLTIPRENYHNAIIENPKDIEITRTPIIIIAASIAMIMALIILSYVNRMDTPKKPPTTPIISLSQDKKK